LALSGTPALYIAGVKDIFDNDWVEGNAYPWLNYEWEWSPPYEEEPGGDDMQNITFATFEVYHLYGFVRCESSYKETFSGQQFSSSNTAFRHVTVVNLDTLLKLPAFALIAAVMKLAVALGVTAAAVLKALKSLPGVAF